MIRLEDEDGIDGPFEHAVARIPRRRSQTRTTRRLPSPAERMRDIVPSTPAEPVRPGHPVAPWDGVALPRTRTQRIEVLP